MTEYHSAQTLTLEFYCRGEWCIPAWKCVTGYDHFQKFEQVGGEEFKRWRDPRLANRRKDWDDWSFICEECANSVLEELQTRFEQKYELRITRYRQFDERFDGGQITYGVAEPQRPGGWPENRTRRRLRVWRCPPVHT